MNPTRIHDKAEACAITCRTLSTRDECAEVAALERRIWGPDYDEAVTLALLLVTTARGAILIGAFDDDQMIGFVYSLNGVKNGTPVQWSYKLGVAREYRNEGLGRRLKLLQRERAIEMGVNLIEWTFDPLLAPNAYLNLTKLGAVVHEYTEDLYGQSLAPVLHRKIPTDRLIATWDLQANHVRKRLSSPAPSVDGGTAKHLLEDAVRVNHARKRGEWLECCDVALEIKAPRLMIEIPLDYSEMVTRAPLTALDWRLSVRQIFNAYLQRGYGAVEFIIDAFNRRGAYLLVPTAESNQRQKSAFSPAHSLSI